MNNVTVEGTLRSSFGKAETKILRSNGHVPGVIYGGTETVHFSAPMIAFRTLVYTPDFQLADIKVGEKSFRCILKDMQFDVLTDELSHIDFLELVEDRKVVANLPLKYVGQPIGVKNGGRLEVKVKRLKVRTMPKNLRENIEVNIDKLDIGENIRVENVVAENMEIMNSPRIPIASVVTTRALRQAETEEAKAATAAKGKK